MFKKILIANRGEIAVRIIRACRDLGLSPVCVYSEADRDALHVKLADEAWPVGPASSLESYLRVDRILDAARRSGAEAVHPGYGFLSESETLAEACEQAGFVFIGPSARVIRLMGTKIGGREAAEAAGIPTVPGSGAVTTPESALKEAKALGFPVLIKADSGGGGKGMRLAADPDQLIQGLEPARQEAGASFGDPSVYLEKYLERPRHIEIQVLADGHGNTIHLGERECSIQRRHQKIVEESPSPLDDPVLRDKLGSAAVRLALSVGYQNAGTVEFMVDSANPDSVNPHRFYYLEMNTRLQVEHPVTEAVTGMDLVCEQIRIAAGEPLTYCQEDIALRGAAIECRIYAEDPDNDFMPSPGRITELQEPAGPGIRVDSALYPGYEIPLHYDPLVSKLSAWGSTREQAVRRMLRALEEYRIGGVPTGIPFLQRLLSHPEFRAGRLHNRFLEEHNVLATTGQEPEEIAICGAGIAQLLEPRSATTTETPARQQGAWRQAARSEFYRRKW